MVPVATKLRWKLGMPPHQVGADQHQSDHVPTEQRGPRVSPELRLSEDLSDADERQLKQRQNVDGRHEHAWRPGIGSDHANREAAERDPEGIMRESESCDAAQKRSISAWQKDSQQVSSQDRGGVERLSGNGVNRQYPEPDRRRADQSRAHAFIELQTMLFR